MGNDFGCEKLTDWWRFWVVAMGMETDEIGSEIDMETGSDKLTD